MNHFLSHAQIEPYQINKPGQIYKITVEFEDLFDQGLLPELQTILGQKKGTEEYQILVDIYLSCLGQRLLEIRLAFDNQDWKTLHRLFHNFKASSGYVGGRYIAWLSENLGQMSLDNLNQMDRFEPKFELFYLEVDRLKQHLESELS